MKLTGIMTCGTYYSPWTPYCIASIYPICSEIIVTNGGFDLRDPKRNEFNIPLEKVSRDISDLDIYGKIYEWIGWTLADLKHKLILSTEKDHPPIPFWGDLRGIGLTLALEKAIERGADLILKIDSDQVCYANCIQYKDDLRNGRVSSVIFKQYEFAPDIYHLAVPQPDSFYNDSVYSFRAHPDDFFGGGGAPVIHSNRVPCEKYWCTHLRGANPLDLSESEKFNHFYGRCWFRYYTNEGLWGEELRDKASSSANSMLGAKGEKSSIPPPEVFLHSSPREYIEEVIKAV